MLVLLGSSLVAAQAPGSADTVKQAALLKLVERPRVEPKPGVRPVAANGLRLVIEHVSLSVENNQRVTGLLIKNLDSTGRQPVII